MNNYRISCVSNVHVAETFYMSNHIRPVYSVRLSMAVHVMAPRIYNILPKEIVRTIIENCYHN